MCSNGKGHEVLMTVTECNTFDGRTAIANVIVTVLQRMLARDVGTPGSYCWLMDAKGEPVLVNGEMVDTHEEGHLRWRAEMAEAERKLRVYAKDEFIMGLTFDQQERHKAKVQSDMEDAMLWVAAHMGDLWD